MRLQLTVWRADNNELKVGDDLKVGKDIKITDL